MFKRRCKVSISFFWNTAGSFSFEAYTFFFISNSILRVNVRSAEQIYVFKVKSCLGVALEFPKFLAIFLLLPVSTRKTNVRN